VDDDVRLRSGDRGLRHARLGEIAVAPSERMDLVGSLPVTKLVDQRTADEPGGARDQDVHGGRVYWRACALLVVVLLAGCDHGKRRAQPEPPHPLQSFVALDREHQRLVRDYEPVSRALTAYELAFRDWRLGRLPDAVLLRRAAAYRGVVRRSLELVRGDPATGETTRAKRLLLGALSARRTALGALPLLTRYEPAWNLSVVDARRALTLLQDIRDRARLIPLPEDAVS